MTHSPSRAAPDGHPYRRALARLRPAFAAVAVFSALVNILMLTSPLYMMQVYDRVLGSGSQETLLGLFVLVIGLYAFLGFFDFLRGRILARAGHGLDALLGETAFRRWIRPGEAGTEGGHGLRDIETLRAFLGSPALTGLMDLPWIPLYLGVLTLIHPWLGLLTVAGALVVALAALAVQRLTSRGLAEAGQLEAEERQLLEQGRRHAELARAMGMERRLAAAWRSRHDSRLASAQCAAERAEGIGAFSRTFRMFLQSAMLTLSAWLVLRQDLSGGMIMATSVISGRALAPVDQVIGQWKVIGKAREAHARAREVFAPVLHPATVDLPAPTGHVRLESVVKLAPGAAGARGRARLLDRISFTLEPGDALGVIGPSASGKSVLARVLTGIWLPEAGEIRFDGATPDQWDPETLGRHIGYLPQAVELLPGTIRDNIARFDDRAEDAQVIEAARIAGVHEMILALPQGYATRTGAACPLSGGQIQRLGLARAIFNTPRIIVLDEPNANLDQEGDEALRRAILAMRNRGSVVVVMAHRPSALAAVNKVLVLRSGQVETFGPRDSLLGPVMLNTVGGAARSGAGSAEAAPAPRAAEAGPPPHAAPGATGGPRAGSAAQARGQVA
ncbi:MAG: type I secretion system permease/ATPase [Defluviimonas sp.]|nr:type I secretion system permease/ATPase [Defluviimonas sp.]